MKKPRSPKPEEHISDRLSLSSAAAGSPATECGPETLGRIPESRSADSFMAALAELQSAREELRELRQANKDLVSSLDGIEIPIIMLDKHRRIRRYTPPAQNILNFGPGDLGRPIDEIEGKLRVEGFCVQIVEVLESASTRELEAQAQDGRWHRIQIRPGRMVEGEVDGVIVSIIDISTLKHAIGCAEWARDYARDIVEAVHIPLAVLNDRMRVVSANKAFYDLTGAPEGEIGGRSPMDFDIGQWCFDTLQVSASEMVAKNAQFRNVEVAREFPCRGMRTISLSAQPIQPRTDFPKMILLAMEDITERKTLEKERDELLHQAQAARAEAEQANRCKDLFLATLSHELRTPLVSLILQAQLLRRCNRDNESVKRASEVIERSAKMQARLVEDILDISRISAGKLRMEMHPVDLVAVIREAVEIERALAASRAIEIDADLDDGIGEVFGDHVRLQQVIWNLLANAIKFSPNGSRVVVTLKNESGQARVQVIDQGIGIEADFLPHIFTKFAQAEGSITRTHSGLGLGLSIVRYIVEEHGGAVRVESSGKDSGATFSVTLPLISDFIARKVAL